MDIQRMLAALADPTRRELFEQLAEGGPASASELSRRFPVSRQAVAKHLAVLDEAGLVERAPVGREVRYVAHPEHLTGLVEWAAEVGSAWDRRLARLRKML